MRTDCVAKDISESNHFLHKRPKINLPVIFIFLSLTIFITACGGPGEKKAEFDGGYIWTSGNKYIALTEVKPASTQIATGNTSITALLRSKRYYYVLDSTPSGTLAGGHIQGVYIKGDYDFKHFSLHNLKERKLGKNEGFFENKGPADKEKPFYYAAEKISVDKRKDDNGYFFKLKQPLTSGKFVAWIENSFWIFECK